MSATRPSTTAAPAIVVAGSLNLDLVATVEEFPAAGETVPRRGPPDLPRGEGSEPGVRRRKNSAPGVAMLGQVGNDAAGRGADQESRLGRRRTDSIGRDTDRPSGTAIIAVDAAKENRIVIPGANGTFTPERLERSRDLLTGATLVLLQLEIPLAHVLAAAGRARDAGARVMLDPAPACPLPAELVERSIT